MPSLHMDVDRIQPLARNLVRQAAETYRTHLGPDLVSLVARGPAVKGGFIVGSRDVDLVAIVRPDALTSYRALPLDVAIRMHRDLSRIEPAPFRYLQGVVLPAGERERIRFVPETYSVVLGDPNVPVAPVDDLMEAARASPRELEPEKLGATISNVLLDQATVAAGATSLCRGMAGDVPGGVHPPWQDTRRLAVHQVRGRVAPDSGASLGDGHRAVDAGGDAPLRRRRDDGIGPRGDPGRDVVSRVRIHLVPAAGRDRRRPPVVVVAASFPHTKREHQVTIWPRLLSTLVAVRRTTRRPRRSARGGRGWPRRASSARKSG